MLTAINEAEAVQQAAMTFPQEVKDFVLGGRAIFTIRSQATGKRFTYRLYRSAKKKNIYFLSLLTGPNNLNDYSYMGLIDSNYGLLPIRTKGSEIGEDAVSYKAISFFLRGLNLYPPVLSGIDFFHEGRCCRCARTLTVPESITRGIGPECASRGA